MRVTELPAPLVARPFRARAAGLLAGCASVLRHDRAPHFAAALATLLALPALFAGEAIDDHFHRATLRPEGPIPHATSSRGMFGFVDDDAARTRALSELGVLPWWTGEATRAAFFRPLTEVTHRVDYALWPDGVAAMHAHSLAWAALLILAAGALYRRILGRGTAAGLATLLFAIDDAHGLAIGWIANRNALLATLFGMLAISAHDRWRREGSRAHAPIAVMWLAASLLSAEAGLATTAYLGAHALFLDPARGARKLAPLVPHLIVVVLWRIAACGLGYGAFGSGLYVDPLRDPVRFAAAAAVRAPLLLAGQWGPIPADLDGVILVHDRWIELLVALAVVALVAWAIVPRLRDDAVARFFALGMTLSLLPICATFPSDRLLFFVGIGAMGLLARALPAIVAGGGGRRGIGVALGVIHLGVAPLAMPYRAHSPADFTAYLDPCMHAPTGDDVAAQRLVLVNALDTCTAYIPVRAGLEGERGPLSAHTLASGVAPIFMRRESERTLAVRRDDGWFTTTFEQVFWDPDRRWSIGDRRRTGGMVAEIASVTSDGRPREVWFTFDVPLEDPSLRWMQVERGGALIAFTPPRLGGEERALEPVYP